MVLLGLFFLPILVSGGMFLILRSTITWKEFLLQLGVSVAIVTAGYFIATWSVLQDTEHLHGRITGKYHSDRGCCHCRQVCNSTDKDGHCESWRTECDHSYDYEWALNSTLGTIWIETCKHSKSHPTAWLNAYIGEPATLEHSYKNYLKADSNSLVVHHTHKEWFNQIPEYPSIYGFYKVNPVISDGPRIPPNLIKEIREINAEYGRRKQVDITVLLTKNSNPEYAQAVESKWLYGPKNSVNIVMGMSGNLINWVRVVTISKVEEMKIHLRDNLQGKKITDPQVVEIIKQYVGNEFKRTPMAKFEYLAKVVQPPTWAIVLLYIVGLALSIGLGIWSHKEDIFGDEGYRRRFGRRFFR